MVIAGFPPVILKITNTETWGLMWFGGIFLLYGGMAIIRFKKFHEIPEGWTWEEMQVRLKLKKFEIKMGLSSIQKIVLVFLGCLGVMGLVFVFINPMLLVIVVPLGFIGLVVIGVCYVGKDVWSRPINEAKMRNDISAWKVSVKILDSKNRSAVKFWMCGFGLLFAFIVFFFTGLQYVVMLNQVQLIILAVGVGSLVISMALLRYKRKKLSNNEKAIRKLAKKYGMKD